MIIPKIIGIVFGLLAVGIFAWKFNETPLCRPWIMLPLEFGVGYAAYWVVKQMGWWAPKSLNRYSPHYSLRSLLRFLNIFYLDSPGLSSWVWGILWGTRKRGYRLKSVTPWFNLAPRIIHSVNKIGFRDNPLLLHMQSQKAGPFKGQKTSHFSCK